MTETHIAGELHGLSAHPGDIYHRAAMTVEALVRERDEARAAALKEAAKVAETQRRKVLFIRSGCHPTADHDDYERLTYAADHLEDAAAAIRALQEPIASLREAGIAKPNCPNLEGREHD